ncbi:MAG: hypothetical protein ACKVS8_08965 [Phycisphaerales bacterium]
MVVYARTNPVRFFCSLAAATSLAGCSLHETTPAPEQASAESSVEMSGEAATDAASPAEAIAQAPSEAAPTEEPPADEPAAPPKMQLIREGVPLTITAMATPAAPPPPPPAPASAAADEAAPPDASATPPAALVEWRRWTLGRVALHGAWSPVVGPTEGEDAPESVHIAEFRTGPKGWLEASAGTLAALRFGGLTRARVSQWRLGEDEPPRLVVELTRGSVRIRPLINQETGKAADVLVKTDAGDVVVREEVEVAYDAARGVRTRLP